MGAAVPGPVVGTVLGALSGSAGRGAALGGALGLALGGLAAFLVQQEAATEVARGFADLASVRAAADAVLAAPRGGPAARRRGGHGAAGGHDGRRFRDQPGRGPPRALRAHGPAAARAAGCPGRPCGDGDVDRPLHGRPLDPADPHLRRGYGAWHAYGQAKVGTYHFGLGLQATTASSGGAGPAAHISVTLVRRVRMTAPVGAATAQRG